MSHRFSRWRVSLNFSVEVQSITETLNDGALPIIEQTPNTFYSKNERIEAMNVIKNVNIITMEGSNFENGMILFDKKIQYVGASNEYNVNEIENEYDFCGHYVIPGLIDAHCHVGMFEDSLGFEGDDGNEDSDPITPHLRAIDAVNPFDRCFSDALCAGVTAVVTGPGSANPIGGQFAALKTSGICVDDMIIKEPCAMKFALGENPKSVYNTKNQSPMTRMGTVALIREMLYKAKEYMNSLNDYNENPEEYDKPDYDIKCEALIPVFKHEIPVKVHAHRADDIACALRIAKEFDVDVTIEHCTDGDRIAEILKRENVPVMLGPTLSDRSKPELSSLSFATYKNLSSIGISTAIITDHPEIPIEYLPLCSAMAVKNGMDEYKALEGITIAAARNCRIQDRVGSIAVGKDADFVICKELPWNFNYKAEHVFIDGEKKY